MSSRVTTNMLSSNYLRNMNRNLTNMKTLQNQLASGKEIQISSDNPSKATRNMQLHSEMSSNKQYNDNITDISNWLDTTDTALSQMGNVFGRVESLLVTAGNGTYSEDERIALRDEVKEKVSELSQILNTNFDGSYIFGGTKTSSKPTTVVNGVLQYADEAGKAITGYEKSDGTITSSPTGNTEVSLSVANITKLKQELNVLDYTTSSGPDYDRIDDINSLLYNTDTSASGGGLPLATIRADQIDIKNSTANKDTAIVELETVDKTIPINQINSNLQVDISQGVKSDFNKTAVDVLEFTDKSGKSINVSELLTNILKDLGVGGIKSNLNTTELKDIQSVTANLLQRRSETGSMQNRMESAKTNNENQNYNMTDILSKTEDIDLTEKTMEYAMLQTVYTASLQTSGKILPQSLLNYV
ncbi:flagellar hook-associated protein 3 [Clostridium gelidum]|uniref:Flagellar hook-associated protein 3 n=1 Tax=Clostridium gelidum TaxID=704125 RepID=A0ABM7T9N6_9CLOT|nr:flagellar hook-associated protein FlgL [Clostridium gelidum]BCZ48635.1 flagellar hook-associated protein 3 [Clostridium gelidum]